jgi:hypothetical protein
MASRKTYQELSSNGLDLAELEPKPDGHRQIPIDPVHIEIIPGEGGGGGGGYPKCGNQKSFLDIVPIALPSMTTSCPRRNPSFLLYFTNSRPQKKNSTVEKLLPQLCAQSALSSAFMVKNEF